MAQVAARHDARVGQPRADLGQRRDVESKRPVRRRPRGLDRGRRRGGCPRLVGVVASGRAGQLQEHVIERGTAQRETGHLDSGAVQGSRGLLDQLEPMPRGWQREPVGAVFRLRLAAPDAPQHGQSLVPPCRARELDLEDLTADALLQLVAGALGDHPAVVDHRDPIRELVRLLQILRRQHERRSLADELAHDRPDLVAAARVEPGGGLVEEEDPRPRQQARCEVEPAAHPAGVGARGAVGGVGEVEALEQLVRATPGRRRREVEQAAEHHQVLAAREDLVDRRELSRQPEQLTDDRGLVHHVVTEDLGPSGFRCQQRRKHAHQRGLASSVRPEQPEHRALRNNEVDPQERWSRAEALRHSLDADGRRGGSRSGHDGRPYPADRSRLQVPVHVGLGKPLGRTGQPRLDDDFLQVFSGDLVEANQHRGETVGQPKGDSTHVVPLGHAPIVSESSCGSRRPGRGDRVRL